MRKLQIAIGCVLISAFLNFAANSIAPHIDGSGRLQTSFHWTLPFWHLFFPPMLSGPSPIAAIFALGTNIAVLSAILYLIQKKWRTRA